MKRRLLLGIDASRSSNPKPTGVERYSTEIIRALLPEVDDFELRLYTPRAIAAFPRKLQRIIPFPRLWTVVRLSWEMLRRPPDLLFVPAHVLPFFAPRRSFVTIHDVAFEKIPEAYGLFQRLYLGWSTRRAVRYCETVFVPSESVAKDLKLFFCAKRVEVIPHGLLPLLREKNLQKSRTPLFFFMGRLEAKKNLSTLLEAWAVVQKKCSGTLVLAGSPGEGFEKLVEKVHALGLDESVKFPGFVSEKAASTLFHTATAFVFPSLEEGFGLPLLQAFSVGCPVLCSDIPAHREVAGDAALYAEATDVQAFAAGMLKLAGDASVGAELARKGKERVKRYSWKAAARVLASVFRKSDSSR